MLITREMDYAVRIIRALKEGTKVSATEVAKKEHLPQAITYKVLNTYAEKMMGPENTSAIAGAKTSTTILRQMAQNNAMRLWVKNQKIQSAERVQAMEAAKLALLAEEVVGEQAKIYGAAAKQ
ncbi:MAG: hypothetical protein ACFNVI_06380 [Lachnoanaerobaculum gingivalis]